MSEPLEDPATVTATFCATLVDEWVRAGIRHAVVAPGSRSTPMALALANRRNIDLHVHHDERAAGFIALGIGQATGVPAVVLTTSGTAAVELHPAVVEAHQSSIPLVVVTADRPQELWDVGAPQTVDQTALYGSAVRWFAEPGPPSAHTRDSWRSLAARAVVEASDNALGPGPVHLNLSFREPLVGAPADLPEGRPGGEAWHRAGGHRLAIDRAGIDALTELLDDPRGVIVAGEGCGEPASVLALAEATGWPVLADPRSGCRNSNPSVVCHFDSLLRDGDFAAAMTPRVVLRLGELPASKVLGAWLDSSGARQVMVSGDGRWFDPDRTASFAMRAEPGAVTRALACVVAFEPTADWAGRWRAAESAATDTALRVLDGHVEVTEPGVARSLCAALGLEDTLIVSSSMPIRDVEWFGGLVAARVRSNRGANGIDGVLSTAVGHALSARGSDRRTVVLLGDVAFLHDSNALLGLAARHVNLLVVVVDNDGGGIFSFLPQADALQADRFELLFGTPHGVDIETLADAHGIRCTTVSATSDFETTVAEFLGQPGVQVIRATTDRVANVQVHQELNAAVSDAVRGE